jgi:hypothetical protein
MQITMMGIDLGKNSCSVVGLDAAGRIVLRRRMRWRLDAFKPGFPSAGSTVRASFHHPQTSAGTSAGQCLAAYLILCRYGPVAGRGVVGRC